MRKSTQLRALIDGFAARHAAQRVADGENPAPLVKHFQQMQLAARDSNYDRFIQLDRQFHLGITDFAQVPGLVDTWIACSEHQETFRIETVRTCWPDLEVLFEAHRPIVDFICAGIPNAAEDAAHSHLDAIWYRLAEMRGDDSLPADPLARVSAYLAFHCHESTTMEFLAKYVAKISVGHLGRLFREHWGMTFTEYVRNLRMEKATKLLTESDLPIGRIAQAVGYADASRFARHFQQFSGKKPREFRSQAGHK